VKERKREREYGKYALLTIKRHGSILVRWCISTLLFGSKGAKGPEEVTELLFRAFEVGVHILYATQLAETVYPELQGNWCRLVVELTVATVGPYIRG